MLLAFTVYCKMCCRNGAESNQDAEDHEAQLLCLKIKDHLEEMFSDSHLAEDGFLLKHMQKNKQGYVSLKLLTCLKKVNVLLRFVCSLSQFE